jgi:hypothetical protein
MEIYQGKKKELKCLPHCKLKHIPSEHVQPHMGIVPSPIIKYLKFRKFNLTMG